MALHVAEIAMIILRESSVVLYCATRVLYGASLCLDSQHNERTHPGLVLHFAVVLKMSYMYGDSLCREVLYDTGEGLSLVLQIMLRGS